MNNSTELIDKLKKEAVDHLPAVDYQSTGICNTSKNPNGTVSGELWSYKKFKKFGKGL
jgi:hypothetical protein